jgi:hypothetical protein
MEDKNVGLGAAVLLPGPTLPDSVTQALTLMSAVAVYLNGVDGVTANLPAAVATLTPLVEPAGTTPDLIAANALAGITTAYTTITSNATVGSPATIASSMSIAEASIDAYAQAAQATITSQAALITQLQVQVASLQAPKTTVVAPVANPNVMTTSTFLVGVASVLAIGGGVWWVARNAKTKAREAHAAGAFAKKPIANPKQLTTGEAR